MKSDLYFENSNQNFELIQTQIRFQQQPLMHNSNTKFYWTLSNNPADKRDRAQSYIHFRHRIKEHIKKQMCHDWTDLLAFESKLTDTDFFNCFFFQQGKLYSADCRTSSFCVLFVRYVHVIKIPFFRSLPQFPAYQFSSHHVSTCQNLSALYTFKFNHL